MNVRGSGHLGRRLNEYMWTCVLIDQILSQTLTTRVSFGQVRIGGDRWVYEYRIRTVKGERMGIGLGSGS